MSEVLLSVTNIKKRFTRKRFLKRSREAANVQAVGGVSFEIREGESVGLAGESGCGKSTIARMLVGLLRPDEGSISISGRVVTNLRGDDQRFIRSEVRLLFQNPDAALNPHMTVYSILEEPLKLHTALTTEGRRTRIREVLDLVHLPQKFMYAYPHTLSGGEKRRASMARSLAVVPRLLIADEPVSGLDVSIRSQIVALIQELHRELKLTLMIISHDIGILKDLAESIIVMYAGKFVEHIPVGSNRKLDCFHPYSVKLMESLLPPELPVRQRGEAAESNPITAEPQPELLPDEIPFLSTGCSYRNVCSLYRELENTDLCDSIEPKLEIKYNGRRVACHHVEGLAV